MKVKFLKPAPAEDSVMLLQMEISLKDQVVILDEGHNMEDSSRDAASFRVSKPDLLQAIEELNAGIMHASSDETNNVKHRRLVRDMVPCLFSCCVCACHRPY